MSEGSAPAADETVLDPLAAGERRGVRAFVGHGLARFLEAEERDIPKGIEIQRFAPISRPASRIADGGIVRFARAGASGPIVAGPY